MKESKTPGEFLFEALQTEPTGSVLYQEHLKLTDKSHMADFAGFLMPLWYSSITAEHQAVRQNVGLFDCTHMGVLEVAGPDAADFLDLITTNNIKNLKNFAAQYSYILDAAGNVLDDIIVYRRSDDKFMVVVNAANEPKIKAYLAALKNGQAIIDADNSDRKLKYKTDVRDMRDINSGPDCRVDIALQGPASINVLFELLKDRQMRESIENLKPFKLIETAIEGIDCIISRTGYTGARLGFELYVHPENASRIWEMALEKGKPSGILPCGLGARDSLRIETGLPLYGHELAGPFNISPFEAGYGWAVKLEKGFFIGKAAMEHKAKTCDTKVARLQLPGQKGVRPVRQNDGVLDKNGKCVGWVLSCAKAAENQIALALITKNTVEENDPVGIYYLSRNQRQLSQGRKQTLQKEQILQADLVGTVLSRFAKF